MPVVIGSGARLATVAPASPTTFVKAPRPMICAPSCLAIFAASRRRRYVNSGSWLMISLGVPPTEMSQPSASTPVGDLMPVTFE